IVRQLAAARKVLHGCSRSCYWLSMIIAIANSKGGVGKSTLSVHLAAWLQRRGNSVILADCDMQQSSSEWIREAAPEVRTATFRDSEAILSEFPMLGQE